MKVLFIEPSRFDMDYILIYLRAGWDVEIRRIESLKIGGLEFSRAQIDELNEIQSNPNPTESNG